jgi:hypothetical protein
MNQTEIEYRHVIKICQDLFEKKNKDYGTSWGILLLPSINEQNFIVKHSTSDLLVS